MALQSIANPSRRDRREQSAEGDPVYRLAEATVAEIPNVTFLLPPGLGHAEGLLRSDIVCQCSNSSGHSERRWRPCRRNRIGVLPGPTKRRPPHRAVKGYVLMVKRRKEEDIAGVLEFEGRTADEPEFVTWLADHRARKGGKVRVSKGGTGVRVAFSEAADMAWWKARSEQAAKGKKSAV
jgi:hypothetical protein